ncbi:hypothetical protein [Streptomyces shenzhenensis]|uniref:hypothetical protein n=1 Tax=Streptomyces shenzhenensis TaxID=943815 RepID=UPI0015F0BC04|nr:hypothetical protein [Streptomyces shenzhenensis]
MRRGAVDGFDGAPCLIHGGLDDIADPLVRKRRARGVRTAPHRTAPHRTAPHRTR